MKKILITLIAVAVSFCLLTTTAYAGSKQRHRWEGVAIGIGAAILGHAILNNHHHQAPTRVSPSVSAPGEPCYYPPPRYHKKRYAPRRYHRGHWEIRKVWVPPTYKRVWNPGHYNPHNSEWIPGGWIEIVDNPGHWIEKRVWVGSR